MIKKAKIEEVLACRHDDELREQTEKAKELLRRLNEIAPEVLQESDIDPERWGAVFRATVESIRGKNAADIQEKGAFVEAVLTRCVERGTVGYFEEIKGKGRQDWKVVLPDGTLVALECKGAGDGNNTTIYERPAWANEMVIWSQNPHSLLKQPGESAWSAIANRLFPRIHAEPKQRVDAYLFWDGRCGSEDRPCPKSYGVTDGLREAATPYEAASGKPSGWLPPPCVFLFPRTAAEVRENSEPPLHTLDTSHFVRAVFDALDVPESLRPAYVNDARIQLTASENGTLLSVSVVSRRYGEGEEPVHVSTRPKPSKQGH
ncbi:hypothetical protein [Streptomyces barkulensis]|uniref:hypothetical protein n=1 Tax=Streptomyces barkulensis TaxID=1257026 RepID=UPI00117DA98E|nr:hypothetical protein [Streptomyces barkulensis]